MTDHEPRRGVRRYRLRIFDGRYEVLHKSRFVVDVDLDSPTRDGILRDQLLALTELALIANEPMARPVMRVYDLETDEHLLDWLI